VFELRVCFDADRTQRREDGERSGLIDEGFLCGIGPDVFFERRCPEPLEVVQQIFRLVFAVDDVSIVAPCEQLVDAGRAVFERERRNAIGGTLVLNRSRLGHLSSTSGVADCTSKVWLSIGRTMLQTSACNE